MYSQRPCRPGISTSGGPLPRSTILNSVPQRLAGFERVLHALERLALAAQFQERLALEIEQMLLADGRLMGQRAAGEHVRQRASDERVVIADSATAPGQMDAELERGEQAVAAHGNRRTRQLALVPFANPLERERLGVGHQPLPVHRDAIGIAE